MKERIISKGFVFAIIILFVGVTFTPVISAFNNKTNDSVSDSSIGLGFIMCITAVEWHITPIQVMLIPAGFVLVSCTDLDTGDVRYGFTHLFGCHIFKFLKRGHSYNISVIPSNFNADDVHIKNLNSFKVVNLIHKGPLL